MYATRFAPPPFAWRSSAFTVIFVRAPRNHLWFTPSHSETLVHGFDQLNWDATSAQKPSPSRMERSYSALKFLRIALSATVRGAAYSLSTARKCPIFGGACVGVLMYYLSSARVSAVPRKIRAEV